MASVDTPWATRATTLRMVFIVFRDSLDVDVLGVLREMGIGSFTDLPEVYGSGETGGAFHSFEWRGTNSMILAAIDDGLVAGLVASLAKLRDRVVAARRGGVVPLRVFVLPCVQAL
jgi:hypothetical protein